MPDAIVVGAGPAGLSAALGLCRAGARVVVLEQHLAPPPRVCGAFINPEGVGHLETLGVFGRLVDAGAVPVTEATVSSRAGRPLTVPIVREGRAGLAVPRPVLERQMADALADAGGEVRWGERVGGTSRGARGWRVTVQGGGQASLDASLLVAADGRFSLVSGRPIAKGRAGWFGWNASFAGVRQPPGSLSLHFYDDGYVGLLTFADGTTNVCGLVHLRPPATAAPASRPAVVAPASGPTVVAPASGPTVVAPASGPTVVAPASGPAEGTTGRLWEQVLSGAMAAQPTLARLLGPATRASSFRGVGPLPFSARSWKARGVVLAGDAGAVGDPYMGEGISRALGAGPILLALLDGRAAMAGQDAAVEGFDLALHARYARRLRLGAAARWLLSRPRLAAPALERLFSHPSLVRMVLSVAHAAGE